MVRGLVLPLVAGEAGGSDGGRCEEQAVIVTPLVYVVTITMLRKRTGTTKQRSDDRTTNLSRLIIIGNLRIVFCLWL